MASEQSQIYFACALRYKVWNSAAHTVKIEPSHFHTIRHIGGTFGGGKYLHCSQSPPNCQNTEDCRLRWKPICSTQNLDRRVPWLIRVCQVALCPARALEDWKIVVIIPIHKEGDRKECNNYRGISLLILPGKVYAKCLKKHAVK